MLATFDLFLLFLSAGFFAISLCIFFLSAAASLEKWNVVA